FTRITAFEPSATWNADAPVGITRPVGVGLAAATVGDGVAVGDADGATAAPPHVTRSSDAAQATAKLRIRITYRVHRSHVQNAAALPSGSAPVHSRSLPSRYWRRCSTITSTRSAQMEQRRSRSGPKARNSAPT